MTEIRSAAVHVGTYKTAIIALASEVMSRPLVEINSIWSEVSLPVKSLFCVSTVAPSATVVTVSVTAPTSNTNLSSARISLALSTLFWRCKVRKPRCSTLTV